MAIIVSKKTKSSDYSKMSDTDLLKDIHFMVNDGYRFKRRKDGSPTAETHNMSLEEVVEEISKICIRRFLSKAHPLDTWFKKHPDKRCKYILDHPEKE